MNTLAWVGLALTVMIVAWCIDVFRMRRWERRAWRALVALRRAQPCDPWEVFGERGDIQLVFELVLLGLVEWDQGLDGRRQFRLTQAGEETVLTGRIMS